MFKLKSVTIIQVFLLALLFGGFRLILVRLYLEF